MWITFIDQYNPKSPWADKRVRLAANHAVNWQVINEAESLGHSVITGSIIPSKFDYVLPLESYGYDPTKPGSCGGVRPRHDSAVRFLWTL